MHVTLPAIAFGGSADEHPLPTARGPWERWYRAVASGGQGHYAAAAAELRRIEIETADDVLRSLAFSTRASHLRQGGEHGRAVHHDARALTILAGQRAGAGGEDGRRTVACCDALTGLAADNLGRGMFGAAERLLDRVQTLLDGHGRRHGQRTPDSEWTWQSRPQLRLSWVRAELAMYLGYPADAQEQAATALSLAERSPSVRHRIKTQLIAAAAAASAGEMHGAIERGRRVVDEAAATGQLPLHWAAAVLLDSLGAGGQAPDEVAFLRRELVARGGGMR
jgi:hypothetical protein